MNEVLVYGSWFTFAIILYLLLINLLGFIWIFRLKPQKWFWDRLLVGINGGFAVSGFVILVLTVVLFALEGKAVQTGKAPTIAKNLYLGLFITSLTIMLFWMVFLIACSNNFIIMFTTDKVYLFGLSILNSAIVKVGKQNKASYFLEYVYKKEGKTVYTERCRFWRFSPSTQFFLTHYPTYLNVERNNAFFSLDEVLKPVARPHPKPLAAPQATAKVTKKDAKPGA